MKRLTGFNKNHHSHKGTKQMPVFQMSGDCLQAFRKKQQLGAK